MKVGSLCTGYGGYELALAALFDDVELAWYAENDPGASRVMAHHYPGVTNYGDLTTADWGSVPPVDIITAGFPCQPLSTAGKRKGTEDERWLFDDIAGAIGILRPRLVLLENVTGILTLGGTLVVGSLTRLGYDCRWTVVRAGDAGAPHRRARWFCGATDARSVGREPRPGQLPASGGRSPTQRAGRDAEPRRGVTDATDWGRFTSAIVRWERILGRPAPHPTQDGNLSSSFVEWMMGLKDGWVTGIGLSRSQELRLLGNGVVPQQARLALNLLDQGPVVL